MYGMILVTAMAVNDLTFDVLESFYWDCDTMIMKGELEEQDMYACKSITESFQRKFFWDKFVFIQYWNAQKKQQWEKRGYTPEHEHED